MKDGMRLAAVILLSVCAMGAQTKGDVWKGVSAEYNPPTFGPGQLSTGQLAALHKLLREPASTEGWECSGDELDEFIAGLRISTMPASGGKGLTLVEAGAGCARGGQGSNGAMWLVRFDGEKPVVVASPKDGFSGWIFTIRERKDYPDVVLGWHMSAAESNLNYFRFNGARYRAVGAATLQNDDDEHWKIIPQKMATR